MCHVLETGTASRNTEACQAGGKPSYSTAFAFTSPTPRRVVHRITEPVTGPCALPATRRHYQVMLAFSAAWLRLRADRAIRAAVPSERPRSPISRSSAGAGSQSRGLADLRTRGTHPTKTPSLHQALKGNLGERKIPVHSPVGIRITCWDRLWRDVATDELSDHGHPPSNRLRPGHSEWSMTIAQCQATEGSAQDCPA